MKPGTYLISRRDMISAGIAGIGTTMLSACLKLKPVDGPPQDVDPIVTAIVAAPTGTVATGLSVPVSGQFEEAFLYVPSGYQASTPTPLVLMFHAENETAFAAVSLFRPYADAAGIALLAIDSATTTWDAFANGSFGPDVDFMNSALSATFKVLNVDPTRIAVEGYSEGGGYAIAVARANGDFFSHAISFSAAFVPGTTPVGKPKFFLAQGIDDVTVDITETGDVLSANLVNEGYTVDYLRYNGGHAPTTDAIQQAIAWLAA